MRYWIAWVDFPPPIQNLCPRLGHGVRGEELGCRDPISSFSAVTFFRFPNRWLSLHFWPMDPDPDIRWKQRFQNFDRAFGLLCRAMEHGPDALNDLEKEGVIQRFEYCFELAWKTIKDYLEESGLIFATVTPRQVLKEAFAAKILIDGQVWVEMLDQRNLLSHTYSPAVFEKAVEAIHSRYLAAMKDLHDFLQAETCQ